MASLPDILAGGVGSSFASHARVPANKRPPDKATMAKEAKRANKVYGFLTVLIFGVASIALALISLVMIGYAVVELVRSVLAAEPVGKVLDSVSIIVIAIAVFEVAKYLFEEEILRGERELRSVREARQTLTKFLVIIIIAVSLEALVFVFKAGTEDITKLLYPTGLLLAAILLVIGLALFQRLFFETEQEQRQTSRKD
jgi:hypothetical protein